MSKFSDALNRPLPSKMNGSEFIESANIDEERCGDERCGDEGCVEQEHDEVDSVGHNLDHDDNHVHDDIDEYDRTDHGDHYHHTHMHSHGDLVHSHPHHHHYELDEDDHAKHKDKNRVEQGNDLDLDDDLDDIDLDDLSDEDLAALDDEDISDDDIDNIVGGDEEEIHLSPEEEIKADDMMSVAATTALVKDELNTEEKVEFIKNESGIAVSEGFMTATDVNEMSVELGLIKESDDMVTEAKYGNRMIIKLNKDAKQKQLYALAVNVSAAAHGDPDYVKYKKVMKMRRILRARMAKKYHGEAMRRMKVYFKRLQSSKSGILAKIAGKNK